jgi:hypothetical protein
LYKKRSECSVERYVCLSASITLPIRQTAAGRIRLGSRGHYNAPLFESHWVTWSMSTQHALLVASMHLFCCLWNVFLTLFFFSAFHSTLLIIFFFCSRPVLDSKSLRMLNVVLIILSTHSICFYLEQCGSSLEQRFCGFHLDIILFWFLANLFCHLLTSLSSSLWPSKDFPHGKPSCMSSLSNLCTESVKKLSFYHFSKSCLSVSLCFPF